jgi:hypothetical protein
MVTLDGCFREGQSSIARHLLELDRGAHIRTLEQWVELVKPVFPTLQPCIREDLLRIPFTQVVLECTAAG